MVELLAPAGDMECFKAAISAGADAVYVGGDKFGARAYAKNFEKDELIQLLNTAHLFDKKVYLTINTLLKEKELSELIDFILPYYEVGLDGVIVQDFGALSLIREFFPDLSLHASTQMTVTGERGANLLKKFGVSRVVPARELSLAEIIRMKERSGLEIETFVHGAMCYSYSGQCLFSSMLGPRSGNRGRCAGPCRLPYQTCLDGKVLNGKNTMYQLSLKDLCVLEIVPKLIQAGIDSFKIEGRMKSPEYVSFVTGMYRKYIDFYLENPNEYQVSREDMMRLQNNFSRGSVQSGYYFLHNGPELITLSKPGYQSFDKGDISTKEIPDNAMSKTEGNGIPKIDLIGHFTAKVGKPMELHISFKSRFADSFSVTGNIPMQAQNRAATEDDVKKQLIKTGNTSFCFVDLTYEMDANLFLPNKELNELRRNALYKAEELLLKSFHRSLTTDYHKDSRVISSNKKSSSAELFKAEQFSSLKKGLFYVGVENCSQLLALPKDTIIKAVYLSFDALEDEYSEDSLEKLSWEMVLNKIDVLKTSGIEIFLRLPSVVRLKTVNLFDKYRNRIMEIDPDGFLVSNLESLAYVRDRYPESRCIADSGFYLFNSHTCSFYEKLGIYEHILSYELHKKEIASLLSSEISEEHSFILPVYGYIPVMESAGCVLKTNGQCKKENQLIVGKEVSLTDRQNKKFRVLTHCNRCENTIYNTVPLSLHKETPDIIKLPLKGVAIRFTTEKNSDIKKILNYFKNIYQRGNTSEKGEFPVSEFTKGHFMKGVE